MNESLVTSESLAPGIAAVTLNRPQKRNALNVPLLENLVAAFAAVDDDASVRVIVLRANGPVFCAGLDLGESADAAKAERSAHLIAAALEAISGSRAIVIAAVQGSAIAGGAGLMSACDFVVASETAEFGYPEVHRGLVPGLVLTFLRRQLRERDIRQLVLLGELIDAPHARDIGLIDYLVPADRVAGAALDLAKLLLRGAPGALAHTKRLLAQLWHSTVADDLQRAHEHHLTARNSPEASEGAAAFREKREPNWRRP